MRVRGHLVSAARTESWRAWMVVLLGGSVALAALLVFAFRVYLFPTGIGPDREFFRTCVEITEGASSADVLEHMRGYVAGNRVENRLVTSELASTGLEPIREASTESEATFLFYPDFYKTADWCVVVFRDGRVTRTWISPD